MSVLSSCKHICIDFFFFSTSLNEIMQEKRLWASFQLEKKATFCLGISAYSHLFLAILHWNNLFQFQHSTLIYEPIKVASLAVWKDECKLNNVVQRQYEDPTAHVHCFGSKFSLNWNWLRWLFQANNWNDIVACILGLVTIVKMNTSWCVCICSTGILLKR